MLQSGIRCLKKSLKLLLVSTICIWQASSISAQSGNVQIDEPAATPGAETKDIALTNSKTEKRSEKPPVKSADIFIPTEDISEDIAVAYPVDI